MCRNLINPWYHSQNTGSVLLSECDTFLHSLSAVDRYLDKETLFAAACYEAAQITAVNGAIRVVYRATVQPPADKEQKQRPEENKKDVEIEDDEIEDDHGDEALHWRGEDVQQSLVVRSVSMGASLFAGAMYDASACVWHLKTSQSRTVRVMTVDLSDPMQAEMLHFPTCHALTQLCCLGEMFHPRTRCFHDEAAVGGNFTENFTEKEKESMSTMIIGLHNTPRWKMPRCLCASLVLYPTVNALQAQWSDMCRRWTVVSIAEVTGIQSSTNSTDEQRVFEKNNARPHFHPGSLTLQKMSWTSKVRACRDAGCWLPLVDNMNSTKRRNNCDDEKFHENVGIRWLERHRRLYDQIFDMICSTTKVDDVESYPLGHFLPLEVDQRLLEMLLPAATAGGSTEGGGAASSLGEKYTPTDLLTFSILSGLAISNSSRHKLHQAAAPPPPPLSPAASNEVPHYLTLASLNVAGHRTEQQWEQLLRFVRSVDSDCLALQECPLKLGEKLAHDINMPHMFHAHASWMNNVLISKHPLTNCTRVEMKIDGLGLDGNAAETRSAIVCEMRNITLVATHLDHISETTRVAQLNVLRDALALRERRRREGGGEGGGEREEGSRGMVLMGDLNSVTRSDFNEEQWSQNCTVRQRYLLEPPRCDVSTILSDEMLLMDAATGCRVGHEHQVVVEATCEYGTRVDYICAQESKQMRIMPSTYSVLETGTTDHQLIVVNIAINGGKEKVKKKL